MNAKTTGELFCLLVAHVHQMRMHKTLFQNSGLLMISAVLTGDAGWEKVQVVVQIELTILQIHMLDTENTGAGTFSSDD